MPIVISASDLERLATLHVASVPDSIVTLLGARYARAFYRYISSSASELILLERSAQGVVQGVAVLSFEPATLSRRLFIHTPFLFYAFPACLGLARRLLAGRAASQSEAAVAKPTTELILLFVDARVRGQGLGAKLIARTTETLRSRNVQTFCVKTLAAEENRALDFYAANRFEKDGKVWEFGQEFQRFSRNTDP